MSFPSRGGPGGASLPTGPAASLRLRSARGPFVLNLARALHLKWMVCGVCMGERVCARQASVTHDLCAGGRLGRRFQEARGCSDSECPCGNIRNRNQRLNSLRTAGPWYLRQGKGALWGMGAGTCGYCALAEQWLGGPLGWRTETTK